MPPRAELPDLELACLRILWEGGDLTVREVRHILHPHRPLAYTTVMTVLDRLARKGVVSRKKVGRAHLYHAEFPRAEARERAVRRLLEIYFESSPEKLLTYLGAKPLSPQSSALSPASERLDETLL